MIWLMFTIGQLIHMAVQINDIALDPSRPATSRLKIVQDRLIPIIARLFGCSMLFGITLGGGAPELFKVFGGEAPQWVVGLGGLLANTSVVGYCIAGLIGLGIDAIANYIPGLKAYIPPPITQQQAISDKAFDKGVVATKEAVKDAVADIKPTPPTGPTGPGGN